MKKFAVCPVAFKPVRQEPDHRSEMISQVLFGECFEIITSTKDWHYISIVGDGYQGWINSNSMVETDHLSYANQNTEGSFYVSGFFAKLTSFNDHLMVGWGSAMPHWDGCSCYIGKKKYYIEGEVIQADKKYNTGYLIEKALALLNVPYLWGGRSVFGTDCSGFVQNLFRFWDIRLPRDSAAQYEFGHDIELDAVQSCDLAYFMNKKGQVVHVGVCMGENKIIHASGAVRIDHLDDKGIYNDEIHGYSHLLKGIKRLNG